MPQKKVPTKTITEPVDAFLLYNEQEKVVDLLAAELESRKITTHFWSRDVPLGEPVSKLEEERLKTAHTIIVCLGTHGWRPTHLNLTKRAQRLKKKIIPVIIGSPDTEALNAASGLFRKMRHLDLGEMAADDVDLLASEIRDYVEKDKDKKQDAGTGTGTGEVAVSEISDGATTGTIDADVSSEARGEPLDRADYAEILKAQGRLEEAGALYRETMKMFPENAAARAGYAEVLKEQGRLDEAGVFYRGTMERFPENANARAGYADVLKEQGRLEEAGVLYRETMERFPENANARVGYAELLKAQGRLEEAGALYMETMRMFSENAVLRNGYAEVLKAQGRLDEARKLYRGTVEMFPNDIIARNGYAEVLRAQGRPDEIQASTDTSSDDLDAKSGITEGGAEDNNVYATIMSSDIIKENKDRLGIQADVQTLTAVMMAKDLEPPLAIGLYGDWGTGKTFFIKSMIAAVERLKKMEDSGRFCREVCQIEFNAWHYVDSNLWASLVSNILEHLAAYVSPGDSPGQKQKALIGQLDTEKEEAKAALEEKESIQKQLTDQYDNLQRLQLEREQKEVELGVSDLKDIFLKNENLKKDLNSSLNSLGVPAAIDSAADLAAAIEEANSIRSRAIALFLSFFKGWNILVVGLTVFALVVIIPIYLPKLLANTSETAAYIAEISSKIVAAIGGIAMILRTAMRKMRSAMEKVAEVKRTIDEKVVEKRKAPTGEEKKLQDAVANLKAEEQAAEKHLTTATARVAALEEQIRAFDEGRSLAKFLTERTSSDDYRKHLGLISTIQKDFRALTDRLSIASTVAGNKLKSVDRIILYIDDLDRCPSDKVMEVLQAVHLLLAYPLFIVVVGVDPRWLLHSLEETYSAFEGNGKKTAHEKDAEAGSNGNRTSAIWRTTPQNYLEKIFQIPFNLKRMNSTGYKDLMSGLLGAQGKKRFDVKAAGREEKPADAGIIDDTVNGGDAEKKASTVKPKGGIETVTAGGGEKSDPGKDTDEHEVDGKLAGQDQPSGGSGEKADEETMDTGQEKDPASDQTGEKEEEQPFLIRNEALIINDWEIAFSGKLFNLIPTPRSAKRFSNIYRILKARVGADKLKAFEGESSEKPGTFRNPMLLLAVLVGCPEACMKLFPALIECPDNGWGIIKVIDELLKTERTIGEIEGLRKDMTEADRAEMGELKKRINKIVDASGFPDSLTLYKEWVPRVSRFSFDVGRAVQALQQDDES